MPQSHERYGEPSFALRRPKWSQFAQYDDRPAPTSATKNSADQERIEGINTLISFSDREACRLLLPSMPIWIQSSLSYAVGFSQKPTHHSRESIHQ